MQPDDHPGRAAFEAELARRVRDAVVTEVPRHRARTWLLTGTALVAAVALLLVLVR